MESPLLSTPGVLYLASRSTITRSTSCGTQRPRYNGGLLYIDALNILPLASCILPKKAVLVLFVLFPLLQTGAV